uniref:mRNA-decapping enzyme 2 n=1 Tax=Gongylonema pulchrum TaxID=637853 RepID=A0A183EAD2_9BILA
LFRYSVHSDLCEIVLHGLEKNVVFDEWRGYKTGVPTYGAALLDSTMNHVLLVQGYFAKNSWGFPKGKVNEEEEPMDCASREVWEEVGFDISDKISPKRMIQSYMNDTLIRLYIIHDVPIDFPFAPNTRSEIGKIQWFSLWHLPKDRNDMASCEKTGLNPNCFYTVIPLVRELQAYVTRNAKMLNKLEQKPGDTTISIGARSSSAFSPVHPQQWNEASMPALHPHFASTSKRPCAADLSQLHPVQQHSSPNAAFFKPLTPAQQVSYTGTAFVQMLSSCSSIAERLKAREVTRPVPTVPMRAAVLTPGNPVYDAFKDKSQKKVFLGVFAADRLDLEGIV